MTTAVASPPNFQNISRLNWNAISNTGGGFSAMSTDEVSRMFMPQRKTVQRSNSSSSLSSTSSSGSTVTLTQNDINGEQAHGGKKKARGGFWPVSKSESTSSVSNARANGSLQTAIGNSLVGKNAVQPALPSQSPTGQANGARIVHGQSPTEPAAILALLPMNGTFERKQINLPYFPEVLRIGRQTNAKTVPTPMNGYFDSKVLSRQHAEVWADRSGKVWIRDVKSSNGTFVNGQRLSPENRESEPHELRQHDTLELGIDIVSEDQKTIVHHKVSAKVEYVGVPGNTSNVLDLSFGDLDPSHGGPLLPSPVSSPMTRGRPGAPLANGRMSAPSSVAGSQLSSAAQQRQMNFWGAPLNVEQLVKSISHEMRAARQQADELEQTNTFLHSLITSDGEAPKVQQPVKEPASQRQSNGRSRGPKLDHVARFAEPPAPPPQQPLPDKPDSAKASPVATSFTNLLKRNDTAKQPNNASNSPTNPHNSQMMSLIEALSIAKKELDSQGAKVKELEDRLKQERMAREEAEERARKLEQHAAARPVSVVEEQSEPSADIAQSEIQTTETATKTNVDGDAEDRAKALQQNLDQVLGDMQRLRSDVDQFQRRAETAEADASSARKSLAEMIEKLRQENQESESSPRKPSKPSKRHAGSQDDEAATDAVEDELDSSNQPPIKWQSHGNGHVRVPRLPEHLERAVATVLQEKNGNGDTLAQSAPYVSMLGVVLIGVGLMAYLNSWQKGER
ncbi:hypothetical protein LTR99_005389 [Exophiala xenobiotica]|uniref:FHA domain-containing protein n=1 Tax=Vermiconidia calcicola TaxID=1690605 RepID=A0AAV9Q7G7_9PEZI|nr:hypothetical protein LTR96_004225 [Exophiala xenobiotica]KAK5535853.1 hypothetical protein LTR25_005755 [Vermiconidia calcicola]KAK5548793.1 hypothetical protein LTR23_001282 [Chaetothyriales sp. CCFEE 6169]KAK5303627.1 hypothetical protein LTR99_005389 [Exophiala xenobiotica]KAK5339838.1 hypothetical protein LTR98_004640 [Exophiala xenobiotica]